MKQSSRIPMLLALLATAPSGWTADVLKANNTTDLNQPASWAAAVAPTAADVAVWDNTVATTNTAKLGDNLDWLGLRIANPAGLVTIETNLPAVWLTNGAAGLNMAGATVDLTLNPSVWIKADQVWDIAGGRTLNLNRINAGRGLHGSAALTFTNSGTGTALVSMQPGGSGSVGFDDAGGNTNYTGRLTIGSGVLAKNIRNGRSAWGTGNSITLGGGTMAPWQGNWTWTTPIDVAPGLVSTIDNKNTSGTGRYLKLQGVISGSGNLVFADTGTGMTSTDLGFILTAENTLSGTITISSTAKVRVGGTPGDSAATAILGLTTGGTLGSAVITNNGTLTFLRTDSLQVNNPIHGTGSVRIGGSLAGAEAQTITFGAQNTYSGNTIVSMGTLALATGASLSNSPVIFLAPPTSVSLVSATLDVSALPSGLFLNTNQKIVGSSGINGSIATINGSITAGTGSVIVPGGSNSVNTLTFNNNLNLSGGGMLLLDINTASSDLMMINGDVSPSGITTVQINNTAGLSGGSYTLLEVYGSLKGTVANFALAGLPTSGVRQSYTLAYDTSSSPNRLKLVVIGDGNLVWKGDNTANNWDAATMNWINGATPDVFFNNDNVTFDDTGSRSPAINITTVLQPASVTVNASGDYTFAGTGRLSGGGTLIKDGTGSLSLVTSNDFVGRISLINGTLAITNVSALGLAPTFLADRITFNGGTLATLANVNLSTNNGITLAAGGGTVNVATGTTLAMTNLVIGAGSLTKNSAGTLYMRGSNSYTGGTVINAGKVVYGHGAGLGRGATTSGTSGYFAKPFTLRDGIVDINGQASYDPNFTNGTASIGRPVILFDGPITFGGVAGKTTTFQDSSATTNIGWGVGVASTLIYDAANDPGALLISTPFMGSGASGPTTRTFDIGDSAATTTEVNLTATMGIIVSGIVTNQDGRNTTIEKAGTGTLQISATNNFPLVLVSGGTLRVNHIRALGLDRTASIGVSGGAGSQNIVSVSSGTLDLNGFSPSIGGLGDGGNNSGLVRNGSATPVTLTVGLSGTNGTTAAYAGMIENGNGLVSISKIGSGRQTLGGINTYTGPTTVSDGMLLVDGSLTSVVTVNSPGGLGGSGTINAAAVLNEGTILSPGNGLGTLTISGPATVKGTTLIDLDRLATPVNSDRLAGLAAVSLSGSLVVTNSGEALQAGDTFQLFSGSPLSMAFTNIALPSLPFGLGWSNTLALNGSITVVSAPVVPVTLAAHRNGENLEISWPESSIGWQLQVQTNSLTTGLSTNWSAWPGSTTTNQAVIPVTPTNPSVFIRLVYPPMP